MPKDTKHDLPDLFSAMTLQEASLWWGMSDKGVLIRLITEEKRLNRVLLRKSGKIWLTTIAAMREVFGPTNNVRPEFN